MRTIRDCTVCVVGGAGFLGSHLVNYLTEDRNCDVLVLDDLSSGRISFVHSVARFLQVDMTRLEEADLRALLLRNHVQFVFNYMAMPYVPDSYKRPLKVFDINAMAALKVINAAQEAGVEAILQVSSAEVYGGGRTADGVVKGVSSRGITESCPTDAHSSYGASKAAIDALVQVRWREAKTPCIALRQFNCIGERDITHPYVLPEIILQIHHNGPTVRLGNNSVRDFMYAGDAVQAAVELLERGDLGEVYNLGSEESIHIYDLAHFVGKCMGHKLVTVEKDQTKVRPWEIWHLQSDNEKLYGAIGRKSTWLPLEESVRRTIQYFESINWGYPW